MSSVYGALPNVKVHPLYFKEAHLNAARMLAMMGCDDIDVGVYLGTIDSTKEISDSTTLYEESPLYRAGTWKW